MDLRQTWFRWRRISSLLLMAALVVPEVRCCCNQSWGPAGLQRMAPETQNESPRQKCCCCALVVGSAVRDYQLGKNVALEVQSSSRPGCECQIWIAAKPLPTKGQGLEHSSALLPTIHPTAFSPHLSICLSAAGVDSPHLPSLSALEHCAYFQTWRS